MRSRVSAEVDDPNIVGQPTAARCPAAVWTDGSVAAAFLFEKHLGDVVAAHGSRAQHRATAATGFFEGNPAPGPRFHTAAPKQRLDFAPGKFDPLQRAGLERAR